MADIQRFPGPRNDYQVGWNNAIGAYSSHGTTRVMPSMAEKQDANNLREFMRGWKDAMVKLAREANKAMSVSNDAAGGYLAPAEQVGDPIEMLRPKAVMIKAKNPLRPPPGGEVLWQTATIRHRNNRALLDYGYKIAYEFDTVEQVKQFMGRAMAEGWHFRGKSAQVLEAYQRQQQHGVPFGNDWRVNLEKSKQALSKIAAALNAQPPKNVTMKLHEQPGLKPSMEVIADKNNLGMVHFREHADAVAQIAKRLGAKVRSQSSAGMMPLSSVIKPIRHGEMARKFLGAQAFIKALLPPLMPGGTTVRGQSDISLNSVSGPFKWQLDYLVRKEYQFPDTETCDKFVAVARSKGYSIESPEPPRHASREDPHVMWDIDRLRSSIGTIRTLAPGDSVVLSHIRLPRTGGAGFRVSRRHNGNDTYMFGVNTRQGLQVVMNAAQRYGFPVVWK